MKYSSDYQNTKSSNSTSNSAKEGDRANPQIIHKKKKNYGYIGSKYVGTMKDLVKMSND